MGVNCKTVGCLAAIGLSLREEKIYGIDSDCSQKDQRQVLSLASKDKMKPLFFYQNPRFLYTAVESCKRKIKGEAWW